MKRRTFLEAMAAASAAVSANLRGYPSWAFGQQPQRTENNPVLVVIYLRGGQDQLNTIIPYNDSSYYEIRPTIALPAEKVIKLDDQWGFHPALAPLKPFYDQKRVAVVINSGSTDSTRSHFDAQDNMEYAAAGNRSTRGGWLNRYLAAKEASEAEEKSSVPQPEFRALAMQELLPRSLRGSYPVVAVPPNLDQLQGVVDLFEGFYAGDDSPPMPATADRTGETKGGIEADPVMASGKETIATLRRLRQLLQDEYRVSGSLFDQRAGRKAVQEYPGDHFARRMQEMAKVIKAGVGLEVAATDINGWDHHIRMGSDNGALNQMLTFLAQGLAAFMNDLGPHLDRTLILVCTEFGRVCKENGNYGADHGHGGAMWLLGGRVQGGKIYGDWKGLDSGALYEKRDLPVTTDFRAIFAEVLQRHMLFEVPPTFFPSFRPPRAPIGLFG